MSSRQWYIRNGGRGDDLRRALIDRGAQMNWVPSYMQARYESWIAGLNGDWLISRQRFFGVPIPLWYPLDADGSPVWESPIRPDEAALPVDPSADYPPGYVESQRGHPGGFIGDPDVMDTWATSSLTPQIATGWRTDEALHAATFPMDMRPQAHDIIRTWLFSTVVRAHFDADTVPWANCALSGWILDPDRKKMSKSVGNVQVPTELLERFGADAVRYWAACGRPGTDTAFDQQQFKIGRRLAVKLLNASKFVLRFDDPGPGDVTEALDRSMLHRLAALVDETTRALDAFDYARALERTESFFWTFTDDHLELVKARAYGEGSAAAAASARRALRTALAVLQQLFAPFMPFVTEEVWSWWRSGLDPHLAVAPGRNAAGRRGRRRTGAQRGGGRRAGRGAPGQVRGQAAPAHRGGAGHRHRQRGAAGRARLSSRRRPGRRPHRRPGDGGGTRLLSARRTGPPRPLLGPHSRTGSKTHPIGANTLPIPRPNPAHRGRAGPRHP